MIKSIKTNETYSRLNNVLRLEEQYWYSIALFEKGYLTLQAKLLIPTYSFIIFCFEKTTGTVKILLKELNKNVNLRGKLGKLKSKYTYLKGASVRQLKNIVEITIPMETLKGYGSEIKEEVASLYKELKNLNLHKVQTFTYHIYNQALKQIRSQQLSEQSILRTRIF